MVPIAPDRVDPANEGQLVHLTGEALAAAPLRDDEFGITADAIQLIRTAEMFQWVEQTRTERTTNTGGSTETTKTYSYTKEWKGAPVDSSGFKDATAHQNPTSMKYTSSAFVADKVTLGAFDLPDFLVRMIGGSEPLPVETLEAASDAVKAGAKLDNGGIYFGNDPAAPAVGDIRVRFRLVPEGTVSLVAQQAGNSLISYATRSGGKLHLLDRGSLAAEEMFASAHQANTVLTWALRVAGFFLLMVAFSMILRPLAVFASILPFLARIVETGTSVIAFLLAGVLWTIVVAVAWIFYRPVLGIILLLITVALIILIVRRLRMKTGDAAATPGVPSPLDTPPPLN